jgi:hypothetical protein
MKCKCFMKVQYVAMRRVLPSALGQLPHSNKNTWVPGRGLALGPVTSNSYTKLDAALTINTDTQSELHHLGCHWRAGRFSC